MSNSPNQESTLPKQGALVLFINFLTIAVLGLLAYLLLQRYMFSASATGAPEADSRFLSSESFPESTPEQSGLLGAGGPTLPNLPSLTAFSNISTQGINRETLPFTTIPSRPRVDVITYTVETGDSLFSIADKFGLKPETILWGNFETLEDNPHLLSQGQVLNILPTNGTYYKWNPNDTLSGVASQFGVDADAIIGYSGNRIDLASGDLNKPNIEPGQWLIVPGGKRALKDWGPPAITRSNPASARYYGEGHCGSIYDGAIGAGTFVWPTTERFLSGYDYTGIHPAIDIAGSVGNAIFAADSGVVVYAGWSNYGYGYLIVIDHGNGWQSAYAHLSAVAVGCGQSVFQGGYIGGLGSTGNSTGPHLHFELVYNGAKSNPWDYLR
jgi:LysM repeat protein